jgi:hypothetical protein
LTPPWSTFFDTSLTIVSSSRVRAELPGFAS